LWDVNCYLKVPFMPAAKPRLTRAQSQEQTRRRLLEAARREIAQHGTAVSVRDIADAAGFTQGAFYAHFESKELLWLELLREHMAREVATLEELFEQKGHKVRTALNDWLSAMNADADWAMLSMELQLFARRDASFAEHYDALFERHTAALAALIKRLFKEEGVKPPLPAAEIARMLMALSHGLVLQRRPAAPGQADPSGVLIMHVLDALLNRRSAA
jgi:AcrR family transcriptional regulator